MGLITHIVLLATDISDFFSTIRNLFYELPFSVRILIYFIFGTILVLGLMRMILKAGE